MKLAPFCHDGKMRQCDRTDEIMIALDFSVIFAQSRVYGPNPVHMWPAELYLRRAFPPRIILADGSARRMTTERHRYDR